MNLFSRFTLFFVFVNENHTDAGAYTHEPQKLNVTAKIICYS